MEIAAIWGAAQGLAVAGVKTQGCSARWWNITEDVVKARSPALTVVNAASRASAGAGAAEQWCRRALTCGNACVGAFGHLY